MSECTNGVTNTSTSTTDPAGAVIAANDYSPTKISNATERGTTEKQRAQKIIDFFLNKGLPIEVGIGVAGVWSAESNIKTWVYNKNEHSDGYAFRDKHAPNADKFTYKGQTYYTDQANMMKFGYGKGLAQWSWSRNFKFRDWFNNEASSADKQDTAFSRMDEWGANITGTSVITQTAFAWKEMQERTGEFMSAINEVRSHPATNKTEFNHNVTKIVDAVLRGFENGGTKKMATTAQIDKYTWDGGYSGAMKKRVSRALGVAEEVKNDYSQLSYLR